MTRPVTPELEQLRIALSRWDDWPYLVPSAATDVIVAARAVLRLYDEQLAKYDAAMSAAATAAIADRAARIMVDVPADEQVTREVKCPVCGTSNEIPARERTLICTACWKASQP